MVYTRLMTEQYERPNTVSGLTAKRAELVSLRSQFQDEMKKLTVDIDHLDAAIRLFDPTADTYKIKRYVTKHRADKGQVKRFVLSSLRKSETPLTSRQICELWVKDRGLNADESTLVILRKRVGACITSCREQGLVESAGLTTDHDQNGPYKLWRIKA